MRFRIALILALLVPIPTLAAAFLIQFADYYSFYSDVREANVAAPSINLLTRLQIVEGYGNRYFGATRTVNRAEFLTMAMKASRSDTSVSADCFPDVRMTDWFSGPVCLAKALGVVKGKVSPPHFGNVPYFDPAATVTYGEALKILSLLFSYDLVTSTGHWAQTYLASASARRVDIGTARSLDAPLTRGDAARLVAAYLAESNGQLADLRSAEQGMYHRSSSTSSSSSVSSASSVSSSSTSSSASSFSFDQSGDFSEQSQIILLGETGPVVGVADIFINEEPIDVREVGINVTTATPTLQSYLVYDENRRLLGRATLDHSAGTRHYSLTLSPGTMHVDQRKTKTVYLRPTLLPESLGGIGNQIVQVSNIVIEGFGEWSSQKYTVATSDTFPVFLSARSVLTSVKNALEVNAPLVTGVNQRIGSFTFDGRRSDGNAHIDIEELTFTIGATGGAALTNVQLTADGLSTRTLCAVSLTLVTCTSLPAEYGSLENGPRTLTLYGDITTTDPLHASLQLSLNDAGTYVSPGSITWTDGSTIFDWLGLPSPLARGTYYKY